jgi:hypothetical protein
LTLVADRVDGFSPVVAQAAHVRSGSPRSAAAMARKLTVILIAAAVVAFVSVLATLRVVEVEGRFARLDAKLNALSRQISELSELAQATDKGPETASAPLYAAPSTTIRPKIELPTIIRPHS